MGPESPPLVVFATLLPLRDIGADIAAIADGVFYLN